ncbi:MAG: redox-regulated ATPase YchF [Deltaproteobacteria bacterium]|nr:redox-regulated ATPase YchF [Deltaproteobacteria bacterium]
MGFSCGIVGLPNVGKSTIFNAITASAAPASNFPFCTIDPNIAIVNVPDERLIRLAEIFKPEKLTPTTLKVIDIAGLVEGASKGAGLGNQFLAHIRGVDVIAEVLRCFPSPDVVHVTGKVDPLRDAEIINTELALSDLDLIERRLTALAKAAKAGDKKALKYLEILKSIQDFLNQGMPLRRQNLSQEGLEVADEFQLLTHKPIFYVANLGEEEVKEGCQALDEARGLAEQENVPLVVISGKIESELVRLSLEERESFKAELGISRMGSEQVIETGYKLLDLVTFFTAGPKEVRAWTVKRGTTAKCAAGCIHSDIEEGFIKAEIYSYADLIRCGSEKAVHEEGLIRHEGSDYEVQDGDVIFFRFR